MGLHRVWHDWSNLACMHALEKEMSTHSSILAWRIPGTEEPGGLPSIALHSWTRLKWLSNSSSRNSQMEEMRRARCKERTRSLHVFPGCTTKAARVYQSRSKTKPVLLDIYGSFIVKSCSIDVIDEIVGHQWLRQPLVTLPSQEVRWWGLGDGTGSSNPLNTWLVPLWPTPILRWPRDSPKVTSFT